MSSIYIQEPPTSGKVLLKTSVGDIDVELWTRECPKACRNFIQLCMEGYYNGTIFHRVVKGFIAQGGDPNGDGSGGESIYGQPFRDEFHSRLRFARRGLVAMANSDKDDNGSQFFFTLGATPELQNKHTLFGKVTGDTVFNMLKLEEGLVDHNERPLYPHKIIKTEILSNPFDDIVPRKTAKEKKQEKPKEKEKGVKNFGLLSFGEEAEEDEFETTNFVKQIAGKGKSSHDVLDDPKLSKEAIIIQKEGSESPEPYHEEDDGVDAQEKADRIREKLKQAKQSKEKSEASKEKKADEDSDPEADFLQTIEKEKKAKREEKAKQIRDEILSLKKQYKKDQKAKEELVEKEIDKEIKIQSSNELVREYMDEKEKYAHRKEKIPKKGPSREDFTLSLLKKFKNKLESVREQSADDTADAPKVNNDIEEDIKTDSWLAHKLQFEDQAPILAKDASTKSDDWYDVYDPRNPINKRKRGEGGRSDSKRNKT